MNRLARVSFNSKGQIYERAVHKVSVLYQSYLFILFMCWDNNSIWSLCIYKNSYGNHRQISIFKKCGSLLTNYCYYCWSYLPKQLRITSFLPVSFLNLPFTGFQKRTLNEAYYSVVNFGTDLLVHISLNWLGCFLLWICLFKLRSILR